MTLQIILIVVAALGSYACIYSIGMVAISLISLLKIDSAAMEDARNIVEKLANRAMAAGLWLAVVVGAILAVAKGPAL